MTADATWSRAINKVLAYEGGYANNPNDRGGETNYGISKRAYPDLDISLLTREQAIYIYHRDYWIKPSICKLPDTLSGATFDLGVNLGPHTGISLLQTALRDNGPSITIDGIIGPQTIAAAQSANAPITLARLRYHAVNYYLTLIDAAPSQRIFRNAWIRRATGLD